MTDIPEGYTYIRCDRYSREEFLRQFGVGHNYKICKEYVDAHPKEFYTTDDEIALKDLRKERSVTGIPGKTTKKYSYYSERYEV